MPEPTPIRLIIAGKCDLSDHEWDQVAGGESKPPKYLLAAWAFLYSYKRFVGNHNQELDELAGDRTCSRIY